MARRTRIVQQVVDLGEIARQPHQALRDDRLPQGGLVAYRSQHGDGSDPLAGVVGAIVTSFGPNRDHPHTANTLVRAHLRVDYFGSK